MGKVADSIEKQERDSVSWKKIKSGDENLETLDFKCHMRIFVNVQSIDLISDCVMNQM